MKKFLFFILSAVFIFAFEWNGKVNWSISYDAAKNIAAKEHKLVMVDIALTNCPPCRYLASQVYTNDKVANYINKHFVPVFFLADKDSIPLEVQNYFTGSTPTIMFIKPNGELFTYFIGAKRPNDFLDTLKEVESKYERKQ